MGTVRAVSQGNGATRKVLWRFEGDAFGTAQATNPTATVLTVPLRMPGQYFDSEVGTSYNYFRDYDASTGRYVESDPIGLFGGLNTYGYVKAQPLLYVDRLGLWPLGLPEKDQATKQIPLTLRQLVPSLTPAEANQLSKDAIDKLGWNDVGNIKKATPNIMHTPAPDSMDDLSDAQKELVKNFLDKLPSRNKSAVDKVKKACE